MDPWSGVKHVLCVRLDTMSGVLLTTPALRALRQSLPGCRLAMLTSASGAQAARLIPEIDAVFRYEAVWMKGSRGDRPPRRRSATDRAVPPRGVRCRRDFHALGPGPLAGGHALLPGGDSAAAGLHPAEPLPVVHAPGGGERGGPGRAPRGTAAIGPGGRRRLPNRPTSGSQLRVPEQVLAEVEGLLRKRGIRDDEPWVVIHPGATAPARRWPSASFAALAPHVGSPSRLPGCAHRRRGRPHAGRGDSGGHGRARRNRWSATSTSPTWRACFRWRRC